MKKRIATNILTTFISFFLIGFFVALFLPKSAYAETPVQSGVTGTLNGPVVTSWEIYSMGYRFSPTANGHIDQLWSYSDGSVTRTIKLYTDAGVLITSAPITSNTSAGWVSANITPVAVTAGTFYKVVAYPTKNGFYYSPVSPNFPATIGSISISASVYQGADAADSMTTALISLYGLVDISFFPGPIVTPTPSLTPTPTPTPLPTVTPSPTPIPPGPFTAGSTTACATATTANVTLVWTPGSAGATSYNVYRGGVLLTSPSLSASQLVYTDFGQAQNSSFSYSVRASNIGGGLRLAAPDPILVTTPTCSSPTPTLPPGQTPVQTGVTGTLNGPIITSWDVYSMGYRFTPTTNGQITRLWSFSSNSVTRTVKLYTDPGNLSDSTPSTLIASAPITSGASAGWVSANITPVAVTAGTYYRVVVYPTSYGYYYQPVSPNFPATIGNITIDTTIYKSAPNIDNPVFPITNAAYGMVDISFVPGAVPTPTIGASPTPTPGGPTPIPCSVGGSNSAVCDVLGNITNLNFGVTNSNVWWQNPGGDTRFDPGIPPVNIPSSPPAACSPDNVSSPYASIQKTGVSQTPGIIFGGSGTPPSFSPGAASTTGWVISGADALYTGNKSTSYATMKAKATGNNLTLNSFAGACGSSPGCALPTGNGVYQSNTDVYVTSGAFTSGNHIFLVGGNLYLNGPIAVDTGTTADFYVGGDIIVNKTVGEASPQTTCNYLPARVSHAGCTLEGFFSTDKNFILDGTNDCNVQPDLRANISGSVVVNAADTGGIFDWRRRDLCAGNVCPMFSISERPDFLLNSPRFVLIPNFIWREIAP